MLYHTRYHILMILACRYRIRQITPHLAFVVIIVLYTFLVHCSEKSSHACRFLLPDIPGQFVFVHSSDETSHAWRCLLPGSLRRFPEAPSKNQGMSGRNFLFFSCSLFPPVKLRIRVPISRFHSHFFSSFEPSAFFTECSGQSDVEDSSLHFMEYL
jgi:hypothetical protein